MKYRWWNKFYARYAGYFWADCPVCGRMFGGHEWETENRPHRSSLPTLIEKNHTVGTAICPDCTKLGVGDRAWKKAQKEFELSCAESWEAKRTV